MRYLSVCSGSEAATVAWGPLGWKPVAFSEVERFPCAVLAHHYPDVPNLGDMTKIVGVPHRRRRVFLVGHLGDWRPPVAVLFEPHGLRRDTSQGRKTRHVFPCLTRRGATAYDDRTPYVLEKTGVRIATPKEWERLFGFPDDYTLVPYRGKPVADSPRYKALGNSIAVPVMWWIGERIQKWENMYADG